MRVLHVIGRTKIDFHGSKDEQKQFEKLIEVMDKYNLVQTIQEPTRKKNTLDLVFTNDQEIFMQVEVTKTSMSDHNIIEITTDIRDNYNLLNKKEVDKKIEETDLRQLNFHHERVNWEKMKEILLLMPWKEIFNGKNTQECTEIFIYVIIEICLLMVPMKSNKNRS